MHILAFPTMPFSAAYAKPFVPIADVDGFKQIKKT